MNIRRRALVTVLTATVALSGCASSPEPPPATSASTPATTGTADVPASEPTPPDSVPAAGAYVDFSDGAIEATEGPKALFFHAGWCPQCRSLDEDLRTRGAPDGLTVFKVDYDTRTDLRQKYGVTLQTTVVFVDDAGELIASSVLYDDPSVTALTAAMP